MKPEAAPDRSESAGGPKIRASVLIVDDSPANLVTLDAVLQGLSTVRIVKAQSGAEALRAVLAEDFAVIIMDVRMPGMDGIEAAAHIHERERSRSTPIIFVSAIKADAALIVRGYRHGAVDFLVKPFEPEILRSKVAVFVELHTKAEQIKEQEAALRQHEREALELRSERRFHALVDAMPLSTWALRDSGEIQYANRHWLEFSGSEAPASTHLWQLEPLHPEDRDAVRSAWEQAARSGQPFELHCRLKRGSDGNHRWHLVRAVPEQCSRSALMGWIVAATDVDDHKRAAEVRLAREQEAREQAEERNRLKDEFLAVVSHELRTPLSGVLGWVRVLRTGARGAGKVDSGRALEAIERNARAQARLVDDLLDATRMVAGKLHLDVQSIDLRALLSHAVDTVRPTAESKGVRLDTDIEAVKGAYEGDPLRIEQVCWNLLTNAVKFTPPGGRVEVCLRELPEIAELVVRDTGEGIAPSFLPHVFEPFSQADASSTRAHGGLGLGLALVRSFVELHGGTVRADSPGEGAGTIITVTLPKRPAESVHPRESQPTARSAARLRASRLDGLRVLVVDDEPDARALLAIALERRGAEVIVASSVADAAEAFRRARPDIVLSDLAMPQEDGYSLIRWIRAQSPEQGGAIPAAAVTAHVEAEVAERARSAGFQAHVAKPVDPARLASLVARLAQTPGAS